jgi:flagellar protein FlaH
MESLALDIRDQFILGKIRAYAVHESMLDKECETTADEIAAKKTILHTILDYIESSPEKIIIIDSLTVFVSNMDEKEVIGFFTSCKKLCDNGNSIIITVHNYAFNDDVMTRIISICDAHLHMNTENAGEQIVKTMEVSKIRGAQLTTGNVVSFDVKPNFGFKIIPISKAKA